jgi:hypothetical protein
MSFGRFRICGSLTAIVVVLSGCSTIHSVTVDAISDRSKTLGTTYHIEVNDPTGGVESGIHAAAVSHIKDALGARGLYEVPTSVKPDMVISASYGVGHGHVSIVTEQNTNIMLGVGMTAPPNSKAIVVYDKTLELTAHLPKPSDASVPGTGKARDGEELWSVKASITDPKQDISAYLAPLASACIDYIGTNPGKEVILPVDAAHARVLLQQRPPTLAGTPAPPPAVK